MDRVKPDRDFNLYFKSIVEWQQVRSLVRRYARMGVDSAELESAVFEAVRYLFMTGATQIPGHQYRVVKLRVLTCVTKHCRRKEILNVCSLDRPLYEGTSSLVETIADPKTLPSISDSTDFRSPLLSLLPTLSPRSRAILRLMLSRSTYSEGLDSVQRSFPDRKASELVYELVREARRLRIQPRKNKHRTIHRTFSPGDSHANG